MRRRLVTAACLALFVYVFVMNAWFGDDPYITYRTIDNFVNGYGLVWNTGERVQAYTHPLWMLMLSAVYFVTREAYYSTLGISFLATLGTIVVLFQTVARSWMQRTLLTVLLCSSKAWVDYASSGLENPLSYLLLACFFAVFLVAEDFPPRRRLTTLTLCAALAFLNRADTSLLYVVPLLFEVATTLRSAEKIFKTLTLTLAWSVPAWGWLVFATIYYGFPFPNTAYSKLAGGGEAMPFLSANGIDYFANSWHWDPLTLSFIAIVVLIVIYLALRREDGWRRSAAAFTGALLYLAYTMRIGGDYMSGRFFALPFCLAAIVLVRNAKHVSLAGTFTVWAPVVALLGPRAPILSGPAYQMLPMDPTGVRDEAGQYHQPASLILNLKEHRPSPGVVTSLAGENTRKLKPRVVVWGAIGYYGFVSGAGVHDVDPIGLPDPLLARLPPNNADGWGRGHFFHDIPAGYIASIELSQNVIADPALHEYYDDLRLLTRGPIFTLPRFREIFRMNAGRENGLIAQYIQNKGGNVGQIAISTAVVPTSSPIAASDADALDALLADAHTDRRSIRISSDLGTYPLPRLDVFSTSEPATAVVLSDTSSADQTPIARRDAADQDENVAIFSGDRLVALRFVHAHFSTSPDLRHFTELRALDLHDDGLTVFPEIEATKVQFLDLSSNHLASMSGVAALRDLRVLYLARNAIATVSGLGELTNLREVNLSLNRIERIDGFASHENLSALSLEGNPITKIENLENLPQLRFLNLSYCGIDVIENLTSLPNLRYLNLTHDKIRSTRPLAALPNLFYLSLGENPLDFSDESMMAAFYAQAAMKSFYLR